VLLHVHVHFTPSLTPRAGSEHGWLPRLPSTELDMLLLLLWKGTPAVESLIVALTVPPSNGHTSVSHAGHGCRVSLGPGSTGIGMSMLLALPRERLADPRGPCASAAAAAVVSDPALGCVVCLPPLATFLAKDVSLPANASCNNTAAAQTECGAADFRCSRFPDGLRMSAF
jgi:hypothetical protein